MKELGRVVTYYQTESTGWTRMCESYYVRYKEPFVAEITTCPYYSLGSSSDSFEMHKPTLFDKREYKYVHYWISDSEFKIFPGETLEIKKVWMPLKASTSFEYLSKNMECKDFIEYMKDNGMNVCPVRM